jgi:hypothetical protein
MNATEEPTEEYKSFIDEERAWLAGNREEYENLKGTLEKQAFEILQELSLKISQCNADSPSSKSHYAMGQCRQVLAGWGKELKLIEKFDKATNRIVKFDLEEARRED